MAFSCIKKEPKIIPLELLKKIVSKVISTFVFNKKDTNWKTLLNTIKRFADYEDVSLNDMKHSSIHYTQTIDYSSIPPFDYLEENIKPFQNIPYIFDIGDDNITTVIIKKGQINCKLKKITVEMMQILQYLGVIRVFVQRIDDIPYWPDNIIDMNIISNLQILRLEYNNIALPKYLQVMNEPLHYHELTYTNRLPTTLRKLTTSSKELENLSPNLTEFKFLGKCNDEILSKMEFLPLSLEKIICGTIDALYNGNIIVPPNIKYLLLGFDFIFTKKIRFSRIKELFLINFKLKVPNCHYSDNIMDAHFTLVQDGIEDEYYTRIYKQNVELVFEEGIEHLTIHMEKALIGTPIEFFECIKQAPASLKHITIEWYDAKETNYNAELDSLEIEILSKFMHEFPHISISSIDIRY